MPLVVSNFSSVCSAKVSHMTDSVDPALCLWCQSVLVWLWSGEVSTMTDMKEAALLTKNLKKHWSWTIIYIWKYWDSWDQHVCKKHSIYRRLFGRIAHGLNFQNLYFASLNSVLWAHSIIKIDLFVYGLYHELYKK